MHPPAAEPSRAALFGYAAPALPLALLTLPFYVLAPAHYAAIGAPIEAVGIVLLLVRLFDAVTDPLAGYLADRLRSRRIGRKLWVAVGTPIVAVSAAMLFTPPAPAEGVGHLALWSLLLSIGWTIALVPYNAWGAELSPSAAGRSRVAAWREATVFAGTLVALVTPEMVRLAGAEANAVTGETLRVFAVAIALGLPATIALALILTPEPPIQAAARPRLAESFALLAKNRAFLRLVAAYLVNGLANGLPATLFLLYVGERLQSPERAGIFLIVYFAAGLACVPFWLWLSRRIGKGRAWAAGMALACVGFTPAPFLADGGDALFFVVCLVTGVAVGADLVLPASIGADVIGEDARSTGVGRAAIYMAAWGLATKLALALAVGVAFPLLAASGFDPASGARSAEGLAMLAFLYAGAPILLKIAAIAVVLRLRTA
jgi:Na+/melibiose symporter-like transporter